MPSAAFAPRIHPALTHHLVFTCILIPPSQQVEVSSGGSDQLPALHGLCCLRPSQPPCSNVPSLSHVHPSPAVSTSGGVVRRVRPALPAQCSEGHPRHLQQPSQPHAVTCNRHGRAHVRQAAGGERKEAHGDQLLEQGVRGKGKGRDRRAGTAVAMWGTTMAAHSNVY